MQWIQGFLLMASGFALLVYRARVKDFIGTIGFAERYLGSGGTWTFLLLLGLAMFVFGLMWAFGTIQDFLGGPIGGITGT